MRHRVGRGLLLERRGRLAFPQSLRDPLDPEAVLGARSAADGISGFAETLRGKEIDDLIDDATALVKKSPVIAIGTAAAVGFVLARLIKSGIDAAADLGESAADGQGPGRAAAPDDTNA